jgi:molybdenum cofactor cytidylyltransferase
MRENNICNFNEKVFSPMKYVIEHPAIVILAAGMSSRLGTPKQLIEYNGKSLLSYTVNEALLTGLRPVVVVIGAHSESIKREIDGLEVNLIENEQWQEGMASSIRCGVTYVRKTSVDVDGIIFMVCDQPYVSTSLLNGLLSAQRTTGLPIVASSYEKNWGIPALFHKAFFTKLIELTGDRGAKKFLKLHQDLVTTISFPKGNIDIDTKADYETLLNKQSWNI